MKRVLAIDDTPEILDLIRSTLEHADYQVFTCLESRQALGLAREVQPHVVLLDIVMPELDGWELMERFRRDPILSQVPVVICTAYPERVMGRLYESGSSHVALLPKPFDAQELIEVVVAVQEQTS